MDEDKWKKKSSYFPTKDLHRLTAPLRRVAVGRYLIYRDLLFLSNACMLLVCNQAVCPALKKN